MTRFQLIPEEDKENKQIMETILGDLEVRDELYFEEPESPTTIGWSRDADIYLGKIFQRMTRYFDPPVLESQFRRIFLDTKLGLDEAYMRDSLVRMCLVYERVRNYPKAQSRRVQFRFSRPSENFKCIKSAVDWSGAIDELTYNLRSMSTADHVLLVPNLVSDESYPVTTDLYTVSDFLRTARKINPRAEFTLIYGPSIFYDPRRVVQKLGLDNFSREHDVKLVNVLDQPVISVAVDNGMIFTQIYLPKFLLDVDYAVSMTPLKHNLDAGYTGSIKNMMSVLPDFERLRFHKSGGLDGMNRAVADLYSLVRPTIAILDCRRLLLSAQQIDYGGREVNGFGFVVSDSPILADEYAIYKANNFCGFGIDPRQTYLSLCK
ncbi:MAG: hypothetical protein CO092_00065 [Candidatus Aenigmarchaeota archaeon CG_4_9_14_3_um_filter_37_18]|nr:DUF362 domain-containing protein [Candidatus Aenigmarchaeota archaeon]PIW41485.1 MAG: hypothetical protein COW21_01630 [Candidatus Aenigmarchaeota archaeon CG15_BIG_FIL_POST_REV_8_21_14_020_37_27]PIY35206.1 MAG: hypothetical protein COZ04_04205 [Candidatus Aenigmarchaeota archaeon CG_4_10_14_3_um_filter_37_21]PJB76127.1 MAG: hypothetical protein CO092_00065 [Candidatus Aenigmarchaeota archaeon CG_4_9_14_3_um_filter_37_18]